MERNNLIVDTSYWISSFVQKDQKYYDSNLYHDEVKSYKVFITDVILMEIFTVISQRVGKPFLKRLIDSKFLEYPAVNEIFIEKEDFEKIRNEYLSVSDKNISFADLSTVYIAQKYNLKCLTFDKHFKKLGKLYNVEIIGC